MFSKKFNMMTSKIFPEAFGDSMFPFQFNTDEFQAVLNLFSCLNLLTYHVDIIGYYTL